MVPVLALARPRKQVEDQMTYKASVNSADHRLLHNLTPKLNAKFQSILAGKGTAFSLQFTRHFTDRLHERQLELMLVMPRLVHSMDRNLNQFTTLINSSERGMGAFIWGRDNLEIAFRWSADAFCMDPGISRVVFFTTCFIRDRDAKFNTANWIIEHDKENSPSGPRGTHPHGPGNVDDGSEDLRPSPARVVS